MLPIAITHCHCVPHQKASGATVLTFGLYRNTALKWETQSGSPRDVKLTVSSPLAVRGSCRACGRPLFMKCHCRPDGTSVTMGTVDGGQGVALLPRPKEHIFLQEKVAWTGVVDDGLDMHLGFNEPFQRRLVDWESNGKQKRGYV